MTNAQHHNLTWAEKNGYEFNAESEGVIFEGARTGFIEVQNGHLAIRVPETRQTVADETRGSMSSPSGGELTKGPVLEERIFAAIGSWRL